MSQPPKPRILVPEAEAAEMQRRAEIKQQVAQQVVGVLNMHYLQRTANLIAEAAVEELVPQLVGRTAVEFPELVAIVHEWFTARAAAVVAEGLAPPEATS